MLDPTKYTIAVEVFFCNRDFHSFPQAKKKILNVVIKKNFICNENSILGDYETFLFFAVKHCQEQAEIL